MLELIKSYLGVFLLTLQTQCTGNPVASTFKTVQNLTTSHYPHGINLTQYNRLTLSLLKLPNWSLCCCSCSPMVCYQHSILGNTVKCVTDLPAPMEDIPFNTDSHISNSCGLLERNTTLLHTLEVRRGTWLALSKALWAEVMFVLNSPSPCPSVVGHRSKHLYGGPEETDAGIYWMKSDLKGL